MPRTRISLLVILSFVLSSLTGLATAPNLLVIVTDEHNFRTLGCYRALMPEDQAFIWGKGVAVETPHIDSLARDGAICDRFYATSPVCTPSRAALMTGIYPQNTGAIRNDLPMKDEMVTFAEVLRRNGYATGYAGKWHLDGPGKPQFGPDRKFGFEDNRYMFNRGHYKKLVEDGKGPRVGAVNAKDEPTYALDGADEKTFTTDFLADRAIEFIRSNRGKPFCYVVSIPDPHGPNTVRAPYDRMYLNLPFQQPRSAQSKGQNLPPYAATLAGRFNKAQMALYFGMVKCIDDNVGRMIAALRETGALDNTVIVFTSDHGDLCGEHGRDNKGVPMEASARIPFILRAPGTVKPGTVVHQALSSVDFKPTVLSLMGIADPVKTEGRDASPLFTGKLPVSAWKDMAFVRIGGGIQRSAAAYEDGESAGNGWMGVFNSRFKLVVAPGAAPGLFDLQDDPDELHNVFAEPTHRATVKQMGAALLEYARQHKDPHIATPNVRADLEWAESGTGPYAPATPQDGASTKGKAKGKKAKAKQD